jgi:hypothetical protein
MTPITIYHFLPLAAFYLLYGLISAYVMFVACLRCKTRWTVLESFGAAIGTIFFWPIVNIFTYCIADKSVDW